MVHIVSRAAKDGFHTSRIPVVALIEGALESKIGVAGDSRFEFDLADFINREPSIEQEKNRPAGMNRK